MRSSVVAARRIVVTLAVATGAGLVAVSLPFSPVRAVIVSGTSMEPKMKSGDVVLAVGRNAYRRDDVIVFRVPNGGAGAGKLVIHRVVGGNGRDGYWMQGDNREGRDPWRPTADDVVGTAALHIPRVGLAPFYLRTAAGMALLAALVSVATFLSLSRPAPPPRGSAIRSRA